jgi:nucleotide-binding universal stress UspA family protein
MKVLLAIDGSPCSRVVVEEVARRGWPPGSVLKVITVIPPLEKSFLRASHTVLDELAREQREDASKLLSDVADELRRGVPGVPVESQLLEGWPKEAILDEAERWGADLIVIGSHGYGTLRRFFLGSVSMTVAMNATCSVLIVRPPADAASP